MDAAETYELTKKYSRLYAGGVADQILKEAIDLIRYHATRGRYDAVFFRDSTNSLKMLEFEEVQNDALYLLGDNLALMGYFTTTNRDDPNQRRFLSVSWING